MTVPPVASLQRRGELRAHRSVELALRVVSAPDRALLAVEHRRHLRLPAQPGRGVRVEPAEPRLYVRNP
jgi:hypothetical protein